MSEEDELQSKEPTEQLLMVHSFEIFEVSALVNSAGDEDAMDTMDSILVKFVGHLNSPEGVAAAQVQPFEFEVMVPHYLGHALAFNLTKGLTRQCKEIHGRLNAEDMPGHPG
jgi:hypothetical protein